jgi:hypothetical protein
VPLQEVTQPPLHLRLLRCCTRTEALRPRPFFEGRSARVRSCRVRHPYTLAWDEPVSCNLAFTRAAPHEPWMQSALRRSGVVRRFRMAMFLQTGTAGVQVAEACRGQGVWGDCGPHSCHVTLQKGPMLRYKADGA